MHVPRHSRKARIILASIAVIAAALWAAAVAVRGRVGDQAMILLATAAVTCTLALVIILAALNVRDRHAALVLRVLAGVTRPAAPARVKTTIPLHVVR